MTHRTRTSAVAALLLATGLAITARAQNTQLLFEASTDAGRTWSRQVEAPADGNVLVRLRVQLINTDRQVFGLAGLTLQPYLTNWRPQVDQRLAFTPHPGSNGTPEEPQTNLGRIYPFGTGVLTVSGEITSHVDPGNILRIACANAVTPTTNLAWGVPIGQLPHGNNPTGFRSGTDAVVFRYGVRLDRAVERSLLASVDRSTILNARGSWYFTQFGAIILASIRDEDILPATINVVPAPALFHAILVVPLLIPRRRRP